MGIWMPTWALILECTVVAGTGVVAVVETTYQRGWAAGAESVRDEFKRGEREREQQEKARADAASKVASKAAAAQSTQQVDVPASPVVVPFRTAPAPVFGPSATLYRTATTSRPIPPPAPCRRHGRCTCRCTCAASERTNRDRSTSRIGIGGPPAPVPNPAAFPPRF